MILFANLFDKNMNSRLFNHFLFSICKINFIGIFEIVNYATNIFSVIKKLTYSLSVFLLIGYNKKTKDRKCIF